MLQLFGGAMQCCPLPPLFVDVSEIRQIPDNQEVHNDVDTGCTVIIELMQGREDIAEIVEAARFLWCDLAKDNDASVEKGLSVLETVSNIHDQIPEATRNTFPPGTTFGCAVGKSNVSKFKEGSRNDIVVAMGVIRIPSPYTTEVIVTVSAPVHVTEGSSDKVAIQKVLKDEDVVQLCRAVTESIVVKD
eukprot:PhF_6_TR6893/c0_g1_i1/m.9983